MKQGRRKFTKPALSVGDQIARIEARGMAVHDRSQAEHYLHHINYYRLQSYLFNFEIADKVSGKRVFHHEASFDDAISLYVFDRQLRILVIDAVERIEVSIRGAWIRHFAAKYGPHGYIDKKLYRQEEYYNKALEKLNTEIRRSDENFIKHYGSQYYSPKWPPIWMATEVMSLGQLSKWLNNLKFHADLQAIAKPYGLDGKVLISLMRHLTYVRNICAHHARLWNRKFTITIILPKSPKELNESINQNSPRKLYNTLAAIEYLNSIIAPKSDWRSKLIKLVEGTPIIDTQAMGFPVNWRDKPLWYAG